jgi:hypothetical protein
MDGSIVSIVSLLDQSEVLLESLESESIFLSGSIGSSVLSNESDELLFNFPVVRLEEGSAWC